MCNAQEERCPLACRAKPRDLSGVGVAGLRARRRRLRDLRFGYARRVEKHSLGAAVVQALVSDCRACGSACETILESWSDERCARGDYGKVVAGAATFAVIADQLETGGTIPPGLVDLRDQVRRYDVPSRHRSTQCLLGGFRSCCANCSTASQAGGSSPSADRWPQPPRLRHRPFEPACGHRERGAPARPADLRGRSGR